MPAETLSRMPPTTPTSNSLLFSKRLCEEKSHKSSSSRLLQLAERSTTNPRKTSGNSSPNHLLSFRNVMSSSKSSPQNNQNSSTFARRNTSVNNATPVTDLTRGSPVRQNPKLYTSFSSKSSSKLTKAFIRSDPLKTNIEHLVSPVAPKTQSPSHSPNSSNDVNLGHSPSSSSTNGLPNLTDQTDHGRGGRSMSNLISTPLKALHASFHDRSKLSSAFAPRTRLFPKDKTPQNQPHSQKEKEKPSKSSNRDKSPDFLEYFGAPSEFQPPPRLSPPHPVPPSVATNTRNYSTPDILENVLNVDHESNYILLERGRRASEDFINRSKNGHGAVAVLRGRVSASKSVNPSGTSDCHSLHSSNDVQISGRNLTDQNQSHLNQALVLEGNLNYTTQQHHPHNMTDTEGILQSSLPPPLSSNEMKMSTATPMKISSSSACRSQIITLMARSSNGPNNDNSDNTSSSPFPNNSNSGNLPKTAGVAHCNSNHSQSFSQRTTQEQNPSGVSKESGSRNSSTWANSKYATNGHGFVETDLPPPIPKRCSVSSSRTRSVVSPQCRRQTPQPPVPIVTSATHSETKSGSYKGNDANLRGTGSSLGGHDSHRHNDQFNQLVSNYGEPDGFSELDKTVLIPSGNQDMTKNSGKVSRKNKRFNLIHSVSFRAPDDKSKSGNGCGIGTGGGETNYSPLVNEGMTRNRSRSLPKSFMSKRKGSNGNRILPSLWVRDESSFETLLEENRSPRESPSNSTSIEDLADKMRWQKSVASTNPEGHGRPKSFDYSQRKAWMKYYRDMEISSTTNGNSNGPSSSSSTSTSSKSGQPHAPRLNKGSISHLHLLPPSSEESSSSSQRHGHNIHPNPPTGDMGIARRTPDALGLPPSLFQRFSKTFSLRFGSSSSVNKVGGGGGGKKSVKTSSAVGSSPDLHRFHDGSESGKMRKGKSKSIREEKCQSGDSGIGIDDSHPNSRLRRIRSEFIETSSHLQYPEQFQNGGGNRNSSYVHSNGNGSSTATTGSALGKMSLVEIPNHVWEEEKRVRQQQRKSCGGLTTTSYEDILESKLDGEDDGFSSGEDSGSKRSSDPSLPNEDEVSSTHLGNRNQNLISSSSHHYHSLPHKNSRKDRTQHGSANRDIGDPNHPGNLTPSGRSKSLEDEQEGKAGAVEDNSIRGKVIREIILTEQNYVKTLNDIVQGFLNPCRARIDLFSEENVRNIFSNVEDILRLHARFLEAMKERLHPTCISSSNIGQIFTEWADHFNLYSEYCCNNPISMTSVRSLMQNQEYAEFFEACRRLQLMDKLPLHGFLLRPIQRICQYHLQLAELLKQTEASHSDYLTVVQAVDTMKAVAMRINDTQRQFDSLQEIIRLQNSIEGWEGPDLLNRNSTILTKGDLVKCTPGKKNKEIFCILLNKDLVFCKKDYVKKGGYVFDGRIDLEVGVWLNIDSNEEDEYFGMVHNSWRVYSHDQKTWVLFTAPTPADKRKWIASFEKAVEVRDADPRMCKMAKLTTLLSDDIARPQSQHYSASSNTLPKSNKKSKGKHSTNGKIDADAMLIEVSKLKRPSYIHHTNSTLQKDNHRGSKFYV